MNTIGQLWLNHSEKPGLRVRWIDWGHEQKYFEIDSVSESTHEVQGHLDSGEKMSYKLENKNWKVYEVGDEKCARAV